MGIYLGNQMVSGTFTGATKTSDLTNDSGFITSSDINDSTISITQGGVEKGQFTLNQGYNQSIEIDAGGSYIPVTIEQDLNNDSNNYGFEIYDGDRQMYIYTNYDERNTGTSTITIMIDASTSSSYSFYDVFGDYPNGWKLMYCDENGNVQIGDYSTYCYNIVGNDSYIKIYK